jgi:mannose PTS system EIID component
MSERDGGETLRVARAMMLIRSLLIQGTWNYRWLIGSGFAFALLPVLRRLHRGDAQALEDATRRHATLFNSHPYMAGLALGGVARLEAEGADAAVIERFKAALRGSLGTLGDRLIWAGWRPVCTLLGIAALLLGAAWWVAAGLFLVIYNAGHLLVRVASMRLGYHHGLRIAERLRQWPITETQRVLGSAGAFLLGFGVPLAAAGGLAEGSLDGWALAAGIAAAAAALPFGWRARRPAIAALSIIALTGLLLGVAG